MALRSERGMKHVETPRSAVGAGEGAGAAFPYKAMQSISYLEILVALRLPKNAKQRMTSYPWRLKTVAKRRASHPPPHSASPGRMTSSPGRMGFNRRPVITLG